MILYVNGQDIARFVLGGLKQNGSSWSWVLPPEIFALGPERYLATLDDFLLRHGLAWRNITGFVVVQGPGSPTALRGIHALVNSWAFSRTLPVFSLEKAPDVPDEGILEGLVTVHSRPYALPVYGSYPHITKSNKDALKSVVPHGE